MLPCPCKLTLRLNLKDTIITAIPSRRNGMTADTLLETIRQGNLEVLGTPNDLVKRILHETVRFLDEFRWAGLGEHVLDIFNDEIATEVFDFSPNGLVQLPRFVRAS